MTTKEVLKYLDISHVTFDKYLKEDANKTIKILPYEVGKNRARQFTKAVIDNFKQHHLPRTKKKQVKVFVYDLDKRLVAEHNTIEDCAKKFNKKNTYINEVLLKHIKIEGKYYLSRYYPYQSKKEIEDKTLNEIIELFPEGNCKASYLKEIREYTKSIIKEYSIINYKWN